ncbi:glycosyltransferase family 4 protein [Tundrisphaera lichenicola]|uniref:glycosyltransferase family 4 protein n=1 Tax=Tundrisphaera lichenicola TaxID=2029860 RepID=UPI003EBF70F0
MSRAWCRGIVSTNPELSESLIKDYGIPVRLIHNIPRGVPEPSGPGGPPRSGRVPVVGAAGPLIAASGYPVFLNAARKVVDSGIDAEFLIAGEGDDEAELRRRAERLRIADRLTFADDLTVGLTFWDALDVFCQTSVAPTTGRSLDLAMAHGVPSVASDVEGLRGRIRDGATGIQVPAGDSTALARAIAGLLSDTDRAGRIGEAGRMSISSDHHPDNEADRLLALYQQVVARGCEPIEVLSDHEIELGMSRPGGLARSAPGVVADS